jgi:hypothetical protein
VEVPVVNFPVRGGVNLTFAPNGKADVERQGTVTRIRIDIDKIGLPSGSAPNMNAFVVWAVSPEGAAVNVGELAVVDGRGRLEATTILDRFGLIVTAEPHYFVDRPGAAVAYTSQEPRDAAIRRIPVRVEVGAYDYSNLPAPPPPAAGTFNWTIAAEARAAVEIARAANAERFAAGEFRLARVALDTMDEMLARNNPVDTVLPAAHDAIRRAVRATEAARAVAAGRDAGFRAGDETVDRSTGALNSIGRDAIQRIVAAAGFWTGPLRVICSPASLPLVREALNQSGISPDRLLFVAQ